MADAHTFKTVTLEAEHVPETHRTVQTDGSVDEQTLPGAVNVYLVFDGARHLLTTFKAGKVFDSLELHKSRKAKTKPADDAADE